MKKEKKINIRKERRLKRVREKIGKGTEIRPRLTVFRSSMHIYAQLVNDSTHKTLAGVSSREQKEKENKTDQAKKVGIMLAEKAKKLNIKEVIFDRGMYRYHGRVKALAEGVREGGLSI